jgi:hypothetical protein
LSRLWVAMRYVHPGRNVPWWAGETCVADGLAED